VVFFLVILGFGQSRLVDSLWPAGNAQNAVYDLLGFTIIILTCTQQFVETTMVEFPCYWNTNPCGESNVRMYMVGFTPAIKHRAKRYLPPTAWPSRAKVTFWTVMGFDFQLPRQILPGDPFFSRVWSSLADDRVSFMHISNDSIRATISVYFIFNGDDT